jgi:DNA-binding NarL/FixJ family response regulator
MNRYEDQLPTGDRDTVRGTSSDANADARTGQSGRRGTQASQAKLSVLIVDDHRALSGALAMAIDHDPGLTCVGSFATLEDGIRGIAEFRPDVVLMDVILPDGDGIDGIRRVHAIHPEARVLILTGHADIDAMTRAAAAGASGFLPKESPIAVVIRSIFAAGTGEMLVDGSTLASILGRLRASKGGAAGGDGTDSMPKLTRREYDVLALMGQGMDPHAIAKALAISLHTCRGYQKSLMAKLGAHSQLEAVVIAARRGMIARFLQS